MAGKKDILQFSCPIYFAKEGEGKLCVDVLRLGSMRGRIKARLCTHDGSAIAGVHYTAVEQELVLEDGQDSISLEIPINEDDRWAPTVEFKINLDQESQCILGAYLYTCRVKVYTDDTFPSNKYREEIKAGEDSIDELSGLMLFIEFMRYNLHCEGMLWRTLLTIVLDQLTNLYLFYTLNARAYLVNMVFEKSVPEEDLIIPNRQLMPAVIGILYFVPILFIHGWKYRKLGLDLEGRTKALLQAYLFRKYLNYNEESRSKVSAAKMQGAIGSKAADLAAAYTAVLDMLQLFGRLALLTVFTLTHEPSSWWVLIVMPTLMTVFGCCRSNALSDAGQHAGPTKRRLLEFLMETSEKYNLVAEYSQRPRMNDLWEKQVERVRKVVIPEAQVEANNMFFPKLLGPLFIGIYIWIWSPQVMDGTTNLGDFLAMISVFGDVSGDFEGIYEKIMTVNSRLDSMIDLTKLLNCPTEVPQLKDINRKRRQLSKDYRAHALKQPTPRPETGLLRADLIPIVLEDVSFGHTAEKTLLSKINLKVDQGKIVALVGQHGQGKGTFLKLLGHRIYPNAGSIFVPTHLRILYVSQQPVLLNGDLWKNLAFGDGTLCRDNPDHMNKVRKIIGILGLGDFSKLLDTNVSFRDNRSPALSANSRTVSKSDDYSLLVVEDNASDEDLDDFLGCCTAEDESRAEAAPDCKWMKSLTYTEIVKISLARALIMNTEMLILNRPFHHFDKASGAKFLGTLKEHHRNRGLGLEEATRNDRRPRSIFFSPENTTEAQQADVIWQIGRGTVYETTSFRLREDFEPE